MQYLGAISKMTIMISVHFQGKPFNITAIQVYAPTRNAEEAEIVWFCEDLQALLELTPKRDVLFIIGATVYVASKESDPTTELLNNNKQKGVS